MTNARADGLPGDVTDGSASEASESDRPAVDIAGASLLQAPETGDVAVDTATAALVTAPDDLDAQVQAGEEVHRTLQARLSDLGG